MNKSRTIRQYTLQREERVKRRKIIEQLFREGVNFGAYPFRVYYLLQPGATLQEGESLLRFGVSVSKRHFKRAVDRNRIKRQIREIYRVEKMSLKRTIEGRRECTLQLFFIYTGKEKPDFAIIMAKIRHILTRLEKDLFQT